LRVLEPDAWGGDVVLVTAVGLFLVVLVSGGVVGGGGMGVVVGREWFGGAGGVLGVVGCGGGGVARLAGGDGS